MKKYVSLLLALLLCGCAAVPAETEPPQLRGSLTVQYLDEAVRIRCNEASALVTWNSDISPEILKNEDTPIFLGSGKKSQFAAQQYLDCARLTLHTIEDSAALELTFGETRFLFLGNLTPEAQKNLAQTILPCHVLHFCDTVIPEESLLTSAAPDRILVSGTADPSLSKRFEAFDTDSLGSVTATSDGRDVTLSWSFTVTDSVASVQPAT